MTTATPGDEPREGASVLIVDDDQELCELMTLRLAARGYRTRAVHSRQNAVIETRENPPDAVVLDLRLGNADGLDVLVDLLAQAPGLKILVLTAHGSIDNAVDGMRRGAYGFMT
jgi:two-component system response regulator GlrR